MEARTTKETVKTGELRKQREARKTKATEEMKGGTRMQIDKGERE